MREMRIAGHMNGNRVGAPPQAEAIAHFNRMTTPPSFAYRDAVNWAIWRWKAMGAWPLIKGLWILAADTSQAALLSVIGDTPRDAVIVGTTPTFTALKGYSGFDVGKQIKFPITSTILASNNVHSFLAARITPQVDNTDPENPVTVDGRFIISDAGDIAGTPGHFAFSAAGSGTVTGASGPPLITVGGHGIIVGGCRGLVGVLAGATMGNNAGGGPARSSNYITRSLALTPLNRLCAYGFLDASATLAQSRQFTGVLATLLDMLGALD